MVQIYNVLLIDDHPLIVKAYKSALLHLSTINKDFKFNIDSANSCDTAYSKIKKAAMGKGLDLIFLDIKLPPSKNDTIISGEDLGIKIREQLGDVKIIVSTTFNENSRINSILNSINPDGFLVKNDLTSEVLTEAITTVIIDPPYYAKTVLKLLRKLSSNDFVLDPIDRKMLYELSKGTKMNELPDILLLSIAAIERRKRILKEVFDVVGKGDRELLRVAEEKGFI